MYRSAGGKNKTGKIRRGSEPTRPEPQLRPSLPSSGMLGATAAPVPRGAGVPASGSVVGEGLDGGAAAPERGEDDAADDGAVVGGEVGCTSPHLFNTAMRSKSSALKLSAAAPE